VNGILKAFASQEEGDNNRQLKQLDAVIILCVRLQKPFLFLRRTFRRRSMKREKDGPTLKSREELRPI
jgi:hypothetical protein